ncbi:hypothetical protein JOC95_001544 [Bacillus tianshenii]|uniref:YhfM-like domain-containing protein n=1 Tax=Sutcliffiella tianshenii TaxID=1463404 RepID=A0ABS2NYD1_9BACI|nr:hypothetical protein [Bacillus tianshenii]MBM7619692.1 hypothetical protein [Bacillus tianshenii]
MKENIIKLLIVFSLGLNVILVILYNDARSYKQEQLDYLYSLFHSEIASNDVHTKNARNGIYVESFVALHSSLKTASLLSYNLLGMIQFPEEDIIASYAEMVKEWLTSSYIPTPEELDHLERDLISIEETFGATHRNNIPKENNLLGWNEAEYINELEKLKKTLYFYNHPSSKNSTENTSGSLVSSEIEKITIQKIDGLSNTPGSLKVITNSEDIRFIQESFSEAIMQPGIADMSHPEYKIDIGEEVYYLWIGGTSGTIMNVIDTNTIYTLSEQSAQRIYELIEKSNSD